MTRDHHTISVRRPNLLGANLRPGQVAGGMSNGGAVGRARQAQAERRINRAVVHAAACAAIARYDLANQPNSPRQ